MMIETSHKLSSLVMALLLLLSTTSWKVEKHFCMGRLMDVSLFVDVDDCGMDVTSASGDDSEVKGENHCCDDESIIIPGQDNLKVSFNDLDIAQQSFLFAFNYSFIDLFSSLKESTVPNEQYPPPILVKDLQLLDEVFLI